MHEIIFSDLLVKVTIFFKYVLCPNCPRAGSSAAYLVQGETADPSGYQAS